MDKGLKKRIGRVAFAVALFFFAGFAYAAFIKLTGWRIPCLFRLVTGLKCPGCGITHSSVCFMKFDFQGMIQYNLFAPAILVYTGWVFAYIGTNQDVDAVADEIGVRSRMNYEYSDMGAREMFRTEHRSRRNLYDRISKYGKSIIEEDIDYFNCCDDEPEEPQS